MSKTNKRIIVGAVAFLLLLQLGWWTVSFGRERMRMSEAKALMNQDGTDEQKREARNKLFELADNLPASKRKELFRPQMEKRREADHEKMKEFFEMSKADQIAEMKKRIAQEEKDRKDRDQRRAQNGGNNGRGGRNGAGGGGAGAGGAGAGGAGAGGAGAGGPGGPGGPGGFGGRRARSDVDKMDRRNERLDFRTSEDRAMSFQMRALRNEVRQQMGLPVSTRGGGGGGGRRGGG